MTALVREPDKALAVASLPALDLLRADTRRMLLDVDEYVFWTRLVGLTLTQAAARLGYPDRRCERYEVFLRTYPEALNYWRHCRRGVASAA